MVCVNSIGDVFLSTDKNDSLSIHCRRKDIFAFYLELGKVADSS